MISPSVMWIEAAKDMLNGLSETQKESQQKELTSFGDSRAQQLGATGLSDDFRRGYELGLQTMRVCIATTMNAREL